MAANRLEGDKAFLLYYNDRKFFEMLPAEECKKLILSAFDYAQSGDSCESTTENSLAFNMAYEAIKDHIEIAKEKFEKISKARAEAGRKGGKQRAANAKQKQANQANANFAKQNQANQADIDTDIDTDTDIDIDTDTGTEKKKRPRGRPRKSNQGLLKGLPDEYQYSVSDPVKDKLKEWLQYKDERKEHYTQTGFRSLVTRIRKAEQQYGAAAVIDLIDESTSNNWQGLIWKHLEELERKNSRQQGSRGRQQSRSDVYAEAEALLERRFNQ